MKYRTTCLATLLTFTAATYAQAGPDDFSKGPLIENYGENAVIEAMTPIPEDATFSLSFDLTDAAKPGELSRGLNTVARFINMHARAGVDPQNIRPALVVHSKAIFDLTTSEAYAGFEDINPDAKPNANAELVEELLKHNARIIICGQSAAYYGVHADDLIPSVEMALSAMTAHVLLQRDGYALNPF